MRILAIAASALPLVLTSLTLSVAPMAPAYAMSNNPSCTVTTYYNNAQHAEEVGTRTQCTGSPTQSTGRVTPWHTSEHFSTGAGGTGHPKGGSNSMPCEFTAGGCSNLPVNRYS